MKRFLFLFTVIAALMNFTSCSNNDDPAGVDPNQPVEIKVSGRALDVVASTRAPFEGITGANKLSAKVMASNTAAKYMAPDVLHVSTMEFGPTDPVGFGDPKPYPHATNPVYLVGLYPSSATWSSVANDNETSFTFTGIEDVMASTEVATVKDDVVNGTHKSLTFHHLLTKLNLGIKAKDDNASLAWGSVTSLQVVSPNNVATVKLGTGSETPESVAPTTTFTGGNQDFTFCAIGLDTPFCSGTSPYGWPATIGVVGQSYALVAPQNTTDAATPIVYTIKVRTEKYNITDRVVPVTLKDTDGNNFVGSTAGQMFDISLTFTATNIEAKATVKPWITGGNGDVDVD